MNQKAFGRDIPLGKLEDMEPSGAMIADLSVLDRQALHAFIVIIRLACVRHMNQI